MTDLSSGLRGVILKEILQRSLKDKSRVSDDADEEQEQENEEKDKINKTNEEKADVIYMGTKVITLTTVFTPNPLKYMYESIPRYFEF